MTGARGSAEYGGIRLDIEAVRQNRFAEQIIAGVFSRMASLGQDKPGDPEGERRLADALRSAKQPGMRQPAGIPRRQKSGFGVFMPDQIGIFAGWQKHRQRLFETGLDDSPDSIGDIINGLCCINHHASVGFIAGNIQKPFPQFFMKGFSHQLIPVSRATGFRATHPDIDRQIKDDRQVGLKLAQRQAVDFADQSGVDAAAKSLIGHGGIGKPVAEDPVASFERWSDQFFDMFPPRGIVKQNFRNPVPIIGFRVEKEFAHPFGIADAPGFPGLYDGLTARFQIVGKDWNLRGFARPFAALEGNKASAHGPARPNNRYLAAEFSRPKKPSFWISCPAVTAISS